MTKNPNMLNLLKIQIVILIKLNARVLPYIYQKKLIKFALYKFGIK